MLKALLSLVAAALVFLAVTPALANQSSDSLACAEQSNGDAVVQLTSAYVNQVGCMSDWDCGYGNICEYNQCRPAQCYNDYQCFSWEECNNGRCERDPWATSCRVDSDCFGGRYCRLGMCKKW